MSESKRDLVRDGDLAIYIGQISSTDDLSENLEKIKKQFAHIPAEGRPAIFCLPECCLWIRIVPGTLIQSVNLENPVFLELVDLAIKKQIAIHLGSVALEQSGQVWNASVWITEDGRVSVSYKKIHLFDIRLEGRLPICESDFFAAGWEPSIVPFQSWKIGESICYDVRFAELFSRYAKEHADVIFVPAAFLSETGRHHWHVLLRARAIESQCYIVAAAQAGTHRSKSDARVRESFGHSLIISPWGDILCEGSADREELLHLVLKKSEIEKVRTQIPMRNHRKLF